MSARLQSEMITLFRLLHADICCASAIPSPRVSRHIPFRQCVENISDYLEKERVDQVLGHSSLNVTTVYLQFNDRDIKEFYDKTPF